MYSPHGDLAAFICIEGVFSSAFSALLNEVQLFNNCFEKAAFCSTNLKAACTLFLLLIEIRYILINWQNKLKIK
jgi:hypothetical protein